MGDNRETLSVRLTEVVPPVQNVALENGLFGLDTNPPSLASRLFIDRYATDSYQNVLFPLIQFPLFVADLRQRLSISTAEDRALSSETAAPNKMTIISHAFKRPRFLELHVPTIGYPVSQTEYIGIDPPFSTTKMAEIEEGEQSRGYGAWKTDPDGTGVLLRTKREKRGWDEKVFQAQILDRLGRSTMAWEYKAL
jgi:hypothetical protein